MYCDDAAAHGHHPREAQLFRVIRAALLAFLAVLTYSVLVGVWSDDGFIRFRAGGQITGRFVFSGQIGTSLDEIASTGHAKASTLASVHSKRQGRSRGDTHLGLLLAVLVGLS
jgi:hypothetical protein